ncbi:DUF4328 domain-containing protein [Microtetraspora sp. AC03309]|uniref:DUF4328 domain-containing protein n=1 Tax=Microtetraspora sp. AC03309 TaxID=2779376 RepID=UPI001E4EE526|nr:DUF4328 domain-containing protein [Microtetraspora sp. AC03309]MCC5576351.1 DUF4328 domain-containing protein [Microtetraspora sp. AC03309]
MYPPAAPRPPLRPVRGLAMAAVVMLAVDSLMSLIVIVVDAQHAALIDRIITDYDSVDPAEVEFSDWLYPLSGVVEIVVYVGTVVMFLVWLFRARTNAELLSPWPQRHTKPWVVLGWFVPIVCWWFPKQIVDDIWNSSKPDAHVSPLATARRSGLVGAWWLAWLISTWGSKLVSRRLASADDLPSMRDAARFDIVTSGMFVVTAALAALVILTISRLQEDRRQAMAAPPSMDGSGFVHG